MEARERMDQRSESRPTVERMVEEIVGCKWSLHVLQQIRAGVCRPGALERSAPGLTAKVLNERLSKMLRFGILERVVYPEAPPRVEYRLTEFGLRFTRILDAIDELQRSPGQE
jgi:DNA-binding HxlR family transcriptional regulator